MSWGIKSSIVADFPCCSFHRMLRSFLDNGEQTERAKTSQSLFEHRRVANVALFLPWKPNVFE
jgi:hypothetical protein